MYIQPKITKWVDNRDSKLRVPAMDTAHPGYREYVLNPNRISDLKVHGTGSSFLFSDNHRDRRESNSYIECDLTVAQIITAHDTAFHSRFITLPFCPKNDPTKTPIDTTLDTDDTAYYDRYNPDPDNFVWLIYDRKAFRRVEQLVKYSLEDIPDVALTGTTTSTTTTSSTTTTHIRQGPQ